MSSYETFGPYQLVKRLATGGMAQIYLARQQGLEGFEKLLVVKRILPHLSENEDFVHMFLDEARIAARLNHPNIVQIFNLGSEESTYFIAMEYIHGEDVRRVWRRAEQERRPLPLPLVCRIMMEACNGLDYAHKKTDQGGRPLGIVHRDISPQNIIVTFEGGVKVVDFGIAKAADQATVTRSGVLKGKYSYMSPEQAAGKKLDHRSDIFALGIVLYELVTATRLFKRPNDIQTLNAVTACDIPLPSKVEPKIPPQLDEIILKALAKDPEHRYQDALQLQLALEDFLLQHRMPSSSAHLAAFMHEIYAERLEREKVEGRVLVDELDSAAQAAAQASGKANGKVNGSAPNSARSSSQTAGPKDPRSDPDGTSLERGTRARGHTNPTDIASVASEGLAPTAHDAPRALQSVRPELAVRTNGGLSETAQDRAAIRRRSVPSWAWAALFILLVGGFAVFKWHSQSEVVQLAKVTLTTVPAGATVVFNHGVTLEHGSPVVLPTMPPGRYPVHLSLKGYRDLESVVTIPGRGEHVLPPVSLQKLPVVITDEDLPDAHPASGEPDASTPGPVETSSNPGSAEIHVDSDPPGAQLTVNGEVRGHTPLVLSERNNASLKIRLEKPGYQPYSTHLRVEPGLTRKFALSALSVKSSNAGTATVTFFAAPQGTDADVTCGATKVGAVPGTGPKQFRAGSYDCTFVNAADGSRRTAHFEVAAGESKQVRVQF